MVGFWRNSKSLDDWFRFLLALVTLLANGGSMVNKDPIPTATAVTAQTRCN